MIQKLRRKFIILALAALFVLLAVIVAGMNILNYRSVVKEADTTPEEVKALVQARVEAKKAKNFAEADRIRDELKAKGIEIIDTPQGAKWKRIEA